ncbi:MAG TPA: MFS transporter [Solirubrobacterales bacterium]|jgi:MFS family permease|nr:MFS transporter [Solirubrobacterales bacterium]HYY73885.1 MFS transporter [Solirubrobacterales bacterium]
MALGITVASSYLPVVATGFTNSTTVIGLIIGGEGMIALWLPLIVGSWSDRLATPIGRRLPFVIAGAPLMVLGLLLMGLVQSLAALAIVVAAFFIGYFIAYEPYRALYPDLLEDRVAGRAQGNQAVWRGVGTGLALLSGGLLLSVSDFLPFAAAAVVLAASIGVFALLILRMDLGLTQRQPPGEGIREAADRIRNLLRDHPALRAYVGANALWELAMGGLKTFAVLYVSVGLGFSLGQTSLIIGSVAVIVFVGALASGKLADRFGRLRVMRAGLWFYGVALLVPLATTEPALLIPAVPLIAFGGGMIMGLPYALLMPLMPEGEHGAVTGIYSLSRGLGMTLGPLLAGVAVQVAGPALFSSTSGYGAMWIVVAGGILASLPLLRNLRAEEKDRRTLREGGDDGAGARREAGTAAA